MLSSSQLIAHAQVNDNNSAIGQDIRAVLYSWYNANFFSKKIWSGSEPEIQEPIDSCEISARLTGKRILSPAEIRWALEFP